MARRVLVTGMALLLAACGGGGDRPGTAPTTAVAATTGSTLATPAARVRFVRAAPLGLDGRFHAVGLGVDRRGSVYFADTVRHRVRVFDATGRPVRSWGGKGDGPGRLTFHQDAEVTIGGLAVAPDGTVFVADSGNHRVQVLTARGRHLRSWGGPGEGDGQFTRILSLAVDQARGQVYVLEDRNARVQVFQSDGRFLHAFGQDDFTDPSGIAVGPGGEVLVSDYARDRLGDGLGHVIHRYDAAGRRLPPWGRPGTDPGRLRGPTGIAVDADGQVFVSDSRNQRVQVFDTDGNPRFVWGEPGEGPGQFLEPGAVAVGGGYVYVADTRAGRLQVFRLGA